MEGGWAKWAVKCSFTDKEYLFRVILNCCGQSALETEVLAGEDVVGRVSVPGNGRRIRMCGRMRSISIP